MLETPWVKNPVVCCITIKNGYNMATADNQQGSFKLIKMPRRTITGRMKRALEHKNRFHEAKGNHPAPRLLTEEELMIFKRRCNREEEKNLLSRYIERFL